MEFRRNDARYDGRDDRFQHENQGAYRPAGHVESQYGAGQADMESLRWVSPVMAWGERTEETELLWGLVESQVPLNPGQHLNDADLVTLKTGRQGVFKPQSGERDARPSIPKGTYWRREIAAYRLDRILGLNLVPTTVPREIDDEQGSLQDFVDDDVRPVEDYPPIDQHWMAVLDFLIANSDRHRFNWMTQADGRPAATDNGLSFPLSADAPYRSPWLWAMLNKPLDQAVVDRLKGLDEGRCRAMLEEVGIEPPAIEGFVARLNEALQGTITTQAWLAGWIPA